METTITDFAKHSYDIADRQVRAYNEFIGHLRSFGELSRAEAEKVFDFYKSKKMIKISIDRISVKHGRYFDRDFLQMVAENA